MSGMQTQMVRQTAFSGGQVDAVNWRRTDLPGYLKSAQILQNMEVSITQVLKKRRGTKRLANVTDYCEPTSQMFEFRDVNGNFYLIIASNLVFNIFQVSDWSFIQAVTTPYMSADLADIDFTLSTDNLILSHPSYAPARLFISNYGTTPPTFSWEYLSIYPQPAYDFGNVSYVTSSITFTATASTFSLTFTGLGSDPGFTTAWEGGEVIGIGTSATSAAGYGIIQVVTPWSGGVGPIFTGIVQLPFGTPFGTTGAQFAIRQPVFTAALGYPARTLSYQNRLWFGATASLPQTLFGSRISQPINFDVGVGRDADAIIYTLGKTDSGSIVNLNGGKQLEIYTENYEFVCPQDQNVGLTPSTLSIRQQSAFGSTTRIKPETYLNDSYYVSKSGQAIMNFHFNGVGLAYTSANVSLASRELVQFPVQRALQRGTDTSQDNFIYFLNQGGSVISFQFDTGFGLAAITPVVFDSAVAQGNNTPFSKIIDIISINNQVIFLRKYVTSGEYELVMFTDDQFLDDWIITSTLADGAQQTITGLDDYDGLNVDVVYNGQDYGNYLVIDGAVTSPNLPPINTNETIVGLPYDVNIQTMYIFAGKNMMDANKIVTKIYVDYFEALNFYVNGHLVPYQTFANIQAGNPFLPQSGQWYTGSCTGWQKEQVINITQTAPFPLTIQSISYQVAARLI